MQYVEVNPTAQKIADQGFILFAKKLQNFPPKSCKLFLKT